MSSLLIASLLVMEAGIDQVNFGVSSGLGESKVLVNVTLCDAKQFNEVQGFTQLCPARRSMLCMATTATETKAEIFSRVNSLFKRLLEGASDDGCLGDRRGKNLMWAGVTGIVLVESEL